MAPKCPLARHWRVALLSLFTALAVAPPAHALRVVDWNILNYPGSTGPARDPLYRTVLAPLGADVLVTEEMTSQAGVTEYLNSLNTLEPGQWDAAPFLDGNDTDCGLFFKPAKVSFLGQWGFYPNAANLLRLVHVYRLKPVGYSSSDAEFRVYALHLKASTGFEAQRLAEAAGLRDSMNALPPGTHAMVMGDFNFYTGTEPAMTKFLENQVDNDGRLYDPLGLQNIAWQDNTSIQSAWTQSTCKTGDTGCASGAATGGLDDRFDLILPTYAFNDGAGLDLIASSYVSVGNDGLHHNNSIQDPPTIPEGAAYASALHGTSDHLPLRVDLRLPALIAIAPGALNFGSVFVGGPAALNLSVTNPAIVPADALDYSLSASAGFTAPAGSFSLAAGAAPAIHSIGMSTASAAFMSGTLIVTSDDPDHAVSNIALSGTVLDHADASLDSILPVTNQTLDFGTQPSGGYTPLLARVHDRGYNALRARLAVTAANITGGAGRFSIVGGFSPVTVAGVAASFQIQFDDAGATPDSTYQATLTFSSADEPLPGAAPQPDLTVNLTAHPAAGTTATPVSIPTVLRFDAPRPNPMTSEAWFGFDLPRGAPVSLEIFDLAGRRVATLVSGERGAGHYQMRWSGMNESGGRVKAGLYFVRFATAGLHRVERIVRLP